MISKSTFNDLNIKGENILKNNVNENLSEHLVPHFSNTELDNFVLNDHLGNDYLIK